MITNVKCLYYLPSLLTQAKGEASSYNFLIGILRRMPRSVCHPYKMTITSERDDKPEGKGTLADRSRILRCSEYVRTRSLLVIFRAHWTPYSGPIQPPTPPYSFQWTNEPNSGSTAS